MLVGSSPLAESRYGILLLGTEDTPFVKRRWRRAVPVVPHADRLDLVRHLDNGGGKASVARACDAGNCVESMSCALCELAWIRNRVVGANLKARDLLSHRRHLVQVDPHPLFSAPLPPPQHGREISDTAAPRTTPATVPQSTATS